MRALRRDKKLRLTFLALAPVLFLASSAVFLSSPSKPGIAVQLTPGSTTVQRGRPAVYTVTLTSTDGFAGAVVLSSDKLPKNTTAVFSPAVVDPDGVGRRDHGDVDADRLHHRVHAARCRHLHGHRHQREDRPARPPAGSP